MIKNIKWLFLVSLTFIACNDSDDDAVTTYNSSDGQPLTAGSANFSKYVSLGNSLCAGYSDGALFFEGQRGSYPVILSQQFSLVGGGEFKVPFMSDNIGGFSMGGTQIPQFGPRLYFNGVGPTPVSGVSGTDITTHLTGSFNNMGVPGAKSFHLITPGYGTLNPYFGRFASSTSASVLGDALSQSPTFFSLWIGNNDVLSYATSGGTGTDQTGNMNPATYGGNDITDPTVFASVYNTLLDGTNGLTKNGAKGVVANIPYVTSIPFFTTVPTNPIPGLPAANAAQLNQLFGAINQICTATGQPTRFTTLVADDGNAATTEKNPLLIYDKSLSNLAPYITAALTPTLGAAMATAAGNLYGQTRHASNTSPKIDYVLLTSRTIIGTTQVGAPAPFNVVGISYPMGDSTVLTSTETALIKTATDAYNATIRSLATSKGLAFVDANAIMAQVATSTGITANNYTVTSTYVTGGGFSLDGVHPSPRGYALIANKFLEAINATYGSNFKGVDLSNYRIMFPPVL